MLWTKIFKEDTVLRPQTRKQKEADMPTWLILLISLSTGTGALIGNWLLVPRFYPNITRTNGLLRGCICFLPTCLGTGIILIFLDLIGII